MKKEVIRVENLIAKYDDKIILDDVSLSVYENEIMVILGSSGCGKTTLLKNIIRLYEPFSGSVKIFDQDVTGMEEKEFNDILELTDFPAANTVDDFIHILFRSIKRSKLEKRDVNAWMKFLKHLKNKLIDNK